MAALVTSAILGGVPVETLKSQLVDTARESYIDEGQITTYLIKGWEVAVEHFLEDSALDADEEKNLVSFMDRLKLSRDALDQNGAFSRVVKAGVIRDLLEGKVPNRIKIAQPLPFNFQKSEQLIWVFSNVDYLEDRAKTKYEGGSHGVSIRIMKGLYYRVGAFKGEAVSRTERLHVDTGLLGVTTKHIYFSGPKKSLRVRHDNIVSLRPYSDGIAIVRDTATAKPQIFVTSDGWFIHNLLTNVAQLGS
ncbi:MAG: hypothetical protein AAB115_05940 [Pseudomonadota bacterium]